MTDVVIREARHRHRGPAGRLLLRVCQAFAIGASVLLVLMAAMSLASIGGRARSSASRSSATTSSSRS